MKAKQGRSHAFAVCAAALFGAVLFVAMGLDGMLGTSPSEGAPSVEAGLNDGDVPRPDGTAPNDEPRADGATDSPEQTALERGVAPDVRAGGDLPQVAGEVLGDDPSGADPDVPFAMPEGAQYEESAVLVEVAPGTTAGELMASFADGDPLRAGSAEVAAEGLIKISLAPAVSVEDAVNSLRTSELVSSAQPNYRYTVMDDGWDELRTGAGAVMDLGSAAAPNEGAESGDDEAGAAEAGPIDVGIAGAETTDAGAAAAVATDAGTGHAGDAAPPIELGEGAEDAHATDATAPSADDDVATDPALGAAATSTNDTYASRQWALASMHVMEAWDVIKSNKGVTVAILDLGFDVDHPDLAPNLVMPYNAHNAANGGDVSDVSPVEGANHNHGTHVAGIIGAVANNAAGVVGASYNAQLMPIKVVDDYGSAYTADLVKAYDYVLQKANAYNVRVINLSMGTKGTVSADDAFIKKIDEAYQKGIVTVGAAGNSGSGTVPYDCYPGDYKNVVSVMNLRKSGSGVALAESSNRNAANERDKNISAPGTSIYSTVCDGDYANMSGTSMATPQVSAVLALMFAANGSLGAQDAVSLLYGSATDLGSAGWDTTYGYGEVNAYEAVKAARDAPRESEEEIQRKRDAQAVAALSYRTHVQSKGWEAAWKGSNQASGTTGRGLRLEGIQIRLDGAPYTGSIEYRTHVQSKGWEASWRSDGATSGTTGKALRLEAIQIRLTGEMAKHYDVWYRVHGQTFGWMGWAKNGGLAGSAGFAKRLEAIRIVVRPKGSAAPGSTDGAFRFQVAYRTHVQSIGWETSWKELGQTSGTTGLGLRLEGIQIKLNGAPYAGSVEYRTHVQSKGWESSWTSAGKTSGTTGKALRLEAIQIRLTGRLAERYDIWYRVHGQTFGWMGWAKNGDSAGSAGFGRRLEAVQVVILDKGASAPGATANPFAMAT